MAWWDSVSIRQGGEETCCYCSCKTVILPVLIGTFLMSQCLLAELPPGKAQACLFVTLLCVSREMTSIGVFPECSELCCHTLLQRCGTGVLHRKVLRQGFRSWHGRGWLLRLVSCEHFLCIAGLLGFEHRFTLDTSQARSAAGVQRFFGWLMDLAFGFNNFL